MLFYSILWSSTLLFKVNIRVERLSMCVFTENVVTDMVAPLASTLQHKMKENQKHIFVTSGKTLTFFHQSIIFSPFKKKKKKCKALFLELYLFCTCSCCECTSHPSVGISHSHVDGRFFVLFYLKRTDCTRRTAVSLRRSCTNLPVAAWPDFC